MGAAVGGAAAGAAAGSVAGPVGTVVGAAVGAVAGGYAGKAAAESIDPTTEDAYWRENYTSRPYYESGTTYDEYAPAYRYGWESRQQFHDRRFEDVESDLERGWTKAKGNSRLGWEKAKLATRDAWHRVERAIPGDADHDGR
jgi:phage tail tape-measure protein